MNKQKIILMILMGIVLSLSFSSLHSQDVLREYVELDVQSIADDLFKEGKYYEAISFYEKAREEKRRKNPALEYKLAECYRMCRKYDKALDIYENLVPGEVDNFPMLYFWKGNVEKTLEKYDIALASFTTFINTYNGKEKIFIEQANSQVEACEISSDMQLMGSKYLVKLCEGEINNGNSNYGAVQRGDTLWFTGITKDGKNKSKYFFEDAKGKYEDSYVTRIFRSRLGGNGSWIEKEKIDLKIKEKNYFITRPALSPDGKELYYAVCSKIKEKEICRIFKSEIVGGKVSKPENLDEKINNSQYSSKDPMPVKIGNKKVLFFTSDRPGGKGEFDIYFSFYDEFGNYQPPVNLENVNTFLNEHSPFYDIINHVLYFSSEGYKGFGGYDIFKTKGMVNESWEPVENCGYGINSGADDYYYYHYQLSHENYLAYFSSNRVRKNEGFYGDRIYKFNFTMKPIEKAKKVTVHCNILDKESKSTVKDAIISLYHEGKKYKVEEKQQVKEDLFFPVYKDSIYLLTIKKDGYLEKEVKFNASTNIGDTLFLEKIFLDKKEIVQTIENNREVKDEKEVKVNDEKIKHDNVGGFKFPVIYYGFGEYTIETSEKVKLDQLAKYLLNNPDMNIFVASHTDNVDNKNHNFKLSKLRTNTVIDYLVGKGVDKKKLVGQWYGEEHPKIDNQSETGKDNPEGRAQNRRTEFGEIDKNYVSKEGQMVENSPTFQLEKGRQDEGAILDEATLKVVLQKYGHINKPGLSFTVQVGAYINADANLKAKMNLYSKLQEKVNGLIHREQGEKYTKFLIGRVSTMNEAYQIQEAAKQIGIRYAFIVPYFKGDRVRMIDVIEYLAQ